MADNGGKGGKKKKGGAKGKAVKPLAETPAYVDKRIELFEAAKARQDEWRAGLPDVEIEVKMPDGAVFSKFPVLCHKTTPMEIVKAISSSLAKQVVVASADGAPWDLHRPLEGPVECLKFHKFDSEEGKHAFWHSSAHVLGQALEMIFGGALGIGPALEQGFYYDMALGADGDVGAEAEADGASSSEPELKVAAKTVADADFPVIEAKVKAITKANQPFERVRMEKDEAVAMFGYNKYKQEIINQDIPEGAPITVYRCGPLVDLCRGPHLPSTGLIKAFALTLTSSAYWKGKAENDRMSRVYGISFPKAKQLKEHLALVEKAKKNDHRRLGLDQQLFFFDQLSPGSCFFEPYGARMYNALVDFIKEQYWKRGYEEVITPNVYNHKLWQTSGHWQNYAENMFQFECEHDIYALKPMNCPGHCLVFKHRTRSWRDLPLRLADFGVLHRNELSGALSGLTRVRRFQQDDAHIFCMSSQVQDEVAGVLDMLREVYGVFGFTFELRLSTRPEKFMGEIADWDVAEAQLREALDRFGEPWTINEGDGAFYGPKIDITVMDALRRKHQCATCQLDFQLPKNFDLEFSSENGHERPVMIHRAILGSVERMIAILTESYGGLWPFWLAPRQVAIVPIAAEYNDYAESVRARLHAEHFHVEVDTSTKTLNQKVAIADVAHVNYILIVGGQEAENGTVNLRARGEVEGEGKKRRIKRREVSVDDLITELVALRAARSDDLAALRE
ncbi:threonyl-tRNA synthetase [Thecamonas trahens ATCC 50062]|uniref:Probable threonine--tRNA ligase, cytoplasmic n=1 Tax=Thecamonas trahens ATCC 50062 TaxID=461836 RepID=A0A0L0D2R9_THETB|nr:threonyl-tRNA synthetase [Thecamonas trahens ATCC 50062]KNC46594.1 threonyl-tRNA synthetase [Thecamonas trahens ATCC 50062]|eukprot:XP_013760369.1 threonyl-tRNA synthetase [Thecamonas trahens ATCC 50062]